MAAGKRVGVGYWSAGGSIEGYERGREWVGGGGGGGGDDDDDDDAAAAAGERAAHSRLFLTYGPGTVFARSCRCFSKGDTEAECAGTGGGTAVGPVAARRTGAATVGGQACEGEGLQRWGWRAAGRAVCRPRAGGVVLLESWAGDAGGAGVRRWFRYAVRIRDRSLRVVRLSGGYEERAEAVLARLARLARPGQAGAQVSDAAPARPHSVEPVQCGWRSLSKRG